MSRPRRRVAILTLCATVGLGALGAGPALAAPITGSAPGRATFPAVPTGGEIRSASTSVDPDTGAWSTTVRFDAAQSAQSAVALSVALVPQGTTLPRWSFGTDTDPDRAGLPPVSGDYLSPTYGGFPAPAGSIVFSPDRTSVTLTSTDPTRVGELPDYVAVGTGERGGGTGYSAARIFLGPTAPRTTIPARAARLTASAGGTIRVPLSALKTKAERRVTIELNGSLLGLKVLPAKYSARREAVIPLSKTGLRRLGSGNRKVVLQVRTGLDNGSLTFVRRTVRLRRG